MFERRGYQLMIIPLTFWSGVEQGFFGADFTAVSILTIIFRPPFINGRPQETDFIFGKKRH